MEKTVEGIKELKAMNNELLECLERALFEVQGFAKRTGIPQFAGWINEARNTIRKAKGATP